MNYKNMLWRSLGLCMALSLSSCGGGGGGGSSGGSVGGASTSISVTPALGVFRANAVVDAFDYQGIKLATGTTNSVGQVSSLAIPASHTGLVILKVSGGTNSKYFDEASGLDQPITPTDAIYSVIPPSALKAGAAFGITPLSNLLVGLLGVNTSGAAPTLAAGSATESAVNIALLKVQLMTGLPLDVLSAPDAVGDLTTKKDGSKLSGLHGVLLAEMARVAQLQGTTGLQQAKDFGKTNLSPAALQSVVNAVLDATDRLKNNDLLNGGGTQFDNFLAARYLALPAADVSNLSNADALKAVLPSDSKRSEKAALVKNSKDLQGIWSATRATAVVTADRKVVIRISPATGGTRFITGKFKLDSTGSDVAAGTELFIQSNQTTASSTNLTASLDGTGKIMTITISKGVESNVSLETFVLDYETRYQEDVAKISDFEGRWKDVIGEIQVDWTVTNGAIDGTSSSGCAWKGQLIQRPEKKAVIDVSVTEKCPNASSVFLRGIATFKEGSAKGVARISLTDFVADGSVTAAVLLEMVKQK